MKKIFFALMAVAVIALAGCEKRDNVNNPDEENAPENGRDRTVLLTDSNGANQPSYKKAPMRMSLSETPTRALN